ncbi:hypothetical protein D0C16_17410 [Cellvibrio sp. KY-GH-1]|uniref:hypothetical protein n=1 Tax=Cellvibrio sp. KY-GH-1 TaxID=2303332 RepID=UPI0012469E16|nr:hypothetical protein [Cellvibrio sp. KY-GH-1]QEY17609.1 hypothetical protein D0C16_17410 [Cellvibrio sp. KY-GH-1]
MTYIRKNIATNNDTNSSKPVAQSNAGFADRRQSTEEQIAQRQMIQNSNVHQRIVSKLGSTTPTVQLVPQYSSGLTRSVTVTGNSKTKSFEECTYNSVEYSAGDNLLTTGTGTETPANWATWLVNKKGGNNASQLHVVNRRWGGLGGRNDKNIVPGSPAENSHHLHEAEKEFDKCFSAGKAINNCKYECTVAPKYGQAVNVTGGPVDYGDPTITVSITDNGVKKAYPVTDGADGLTFKEGT